VDGLILCGGTKKNRSRSRVALTIPSDPAPTPPWKTQDGVPVKAPEIRKRLWFEWKIMDGARKNPLRMQTHLSRLGNKKGQSRAEKGKTGRNHLLNVSRLRKPQGTRTIQQRNHFSPDPIKSQLNVKNTAIQAT